jgi:hypothetical protein
VVEALMEHGIVPQSGYGMTETCSHQYTRPDDPPGAAIADRLPAELAGLGQAADRAAARAVPAVEQIQWGPLDNMQPADPDDYQLNLGVEPGYVAVKSQLLPQIPQQSMIINYTAGYDDDDPDAVPMPIRHAILLLTASLYEQRGDVSADMPPAATLLMQPYRLWTFAG